MTTALITAFKLSIRLAIVIVTAIFLRDVVLAFMASAFKVYGVGSGWRQLITCIGFIAANQWDGSYCGPKSVLDEIFARLKVSN